MAREMGKTWEAFQVKECGQQHQILVRGLRSSRGMEALDFGNVEASGTFSNRGRSESQIGEQRPLREDKCNTGKPFLVCNVTNLCWFKPLNFLVICYNSNRK